MKAFNRPIKVATNKGGQNTQPKSQPAKIVVDNRASTVLQRKLQQSINASPRVLQAKFGKGLPAKLKANLEDLSGLSLDGVQVHYNSSEPTKVGALAYAQGNDIYLGPGQEKHLAHEAWHIIQQKQGRVRPTMQLENGSAINDNLGLEWEADLMGRRSANVEQASNQNLTDNRPQAIAQRELQEAINNSPRLATGYAKGVIQAYSIKRSIRNGALYSVSDDEKMVVGLGTPNHELYVANQHMIDQMNSNTQSSVLTFTAGETFTELFGEEEEKYIRVNVGFKDLDLKEESMGSSSSQSLKKRSLQVMYNKLVNPGIELLVEEKITEITKSIGRNVSLSVKDKSFDWIALAKLLDDLTMKLDGFKKLFVATLANQLGDASKTDIDRKMQTPYDIVKSLDELLYNKSLNSDSINSTIKFINSKNKAEEEAETEEEEETEGKGKEKATVKANVSTGDLLLNNCLVQLISSLNKFAAGFPKKGSLDIIQLRAYNHQKGMLASSKSNETMFYRACDVMAATLLGNTITYDNQDQLKSYHNADGYAHYAAKILKSGNDWVSLESFAASEKNKEWLGLNDKCIPYNLDNSWQYMMYGSRKEEKEERMTREEEMILEDNFYNTFTRLRYFLMGSKGDHTGSAKDRSKLGRIIMSDFIYRFKSDQRTDAENIFKELKEQKFIVLVGSNLIIKNHGNINVDYISGLLKKEYTLDISEVCEALKHFCNLYSQAPIQNSAGNEMRNIIAWIKLTGQLNQFRSVQDVDAWISTLEEFNNENIVNQRGFETVKSESLSAYQKEWEVLAEVLAQTSPKSTSYLQKATTLLPSWFK